LFVVVFLFFLYVCAASVRAPRALRLRLVTNYYYHAASVNSDNKVGNGMYALMLLLLTSARHIFNTTTQDY
jgi:hypothetical protein